MGNETTEGILKRLRMLALATALLSTIALLPVSARADARCAGAAHAAGDWTSSGADLSNSRSQPLGDAITFSTAPTLAPAWAVNLADHGGRGDNTGTPAVAAGCVYVGTNGGTLTALDAETGTFRWTTDFGADASINSSPTYATGRVYVHVNIANLPYLAAVDATDGTRLWTTLVNDHPGTSVWSSPVVFDGLVFTGIAGGNTSNDLSGGDEGSYAITDATTGALLAHDFTVPVSEQATYHGGSILSTAAIDPSTRYAYVGNDGVGSEDQTGNPESPQMASILKIDVDPSRATFGRIVGHAKGLERYQESHAIFDFDIQASPNLLTRPDGTTWIGAAHKIGTYEMFDTAEMTHEWSAIDGTWSPAGGLSTATDATSIYGANTAGGTISALDAATGLPRWVLPLADGAHVASAPSVTNGVVLILDTAGCVDAFDTATGLPLLHRPLIAGTSITEPTPVLGGGIAIARDTAYAATGTSFGDHTWVIAMRPTPSLVPAP